MRILALPLLILAVGCSKPAREAIVITNETGQVVTNVSVQYAGKIGSTNLHLSVRWTAPNEDGPSNQLYGRKELESVPDTLASIVNDTFATGMLFGYVVGNEHFGREALTNGFPASIDWWLAIDTQPKTNLNVKVSDDAIRALAKSGRICEVLGHRWEGGRVGEGLSIVFADYHPGTTFRHCSICGTGQSKTEGDWK